MPETSAGPPAKKARVGDTTLYRLKVRRAWGAPTPQPPPQGGGGGRPPGWREGRRRWTTTAS